MRIAHLLPHSARFPLVQHHGRHEWALRLARAQVRAGHEVSIYAGLGSRDTESAITWSSLPADLGDRHTNNKALMSKALQSDQHDVLHSHFDSLHYDLAHLTTTPIIATQHWFPNTQIVDAAKNYTGANIFPVAPTRYMHKANQRLGILRSTVIHHGVDLNLFRPADKTRRDRFIFVGRITPSKGALEAVQIAQKYGIKLDIVGKITKKDRSYWEQVQQLVDNTYIRYLGQMTQAEVATALPRARALLFPCQQIEAFGQVIIEAQASGTPVITTNIGAAHELVKHGVSGFIISNQADYEHAIAAVDSLRQEDCRAFAKQFDFRQMAAAYERLYAGAIKDSPLSAN